MDARHDAKQHCANKAKAVTHTYGWRKGLISSVCQTGGQRANRQIMMLLRYPRTRDNISILSTWLQRVLVRKPTPVTLRLLRRRVEMHLFAAFSAFPMLVS